MSYPLIITNKRSLTLHISHKQKLNLINNYVAIYRILFHCKELLLTEQGKSENALVLNSICDQTLDLKKKYEVAFENLKMIDPAFLLLKQQLSSFHEKPKSKGELCSISELRDSLGFIKNDYEKLKL